MRSLALLFLSLLVGARQLFSVPIVTPPEPHRLERLAAKELAHFLGRLYPAESFDVVSAVPETGNYVALGAACSGVEAPRHPDGYRILVVNGEGRKAGCIVGGGPRGTLYGVYGLLDELGFGFFLSYTAEPRPRGGLFAFEGWDLEDRPLFRERFVFNWHNFLSSASTWNYEDWTRYIDQAIRMRYSGIMVHAYGNNPMFSFRYNGLEKPVGYLSTTRSGRDWGTQHVNDVRRLYGAGAIFQGPVFGSEAALAPDEDRVAAATRLMQRVFEYAEARGLEISFAVDVDTVSANPQNIIRTLPESARFRPGDIWLPDPDTPAGAAYFDALFGQLLGTYPQIDQVVLWYRRLRSGLGRTPWLKVTPETMPSNWRGEFEKAVARRPELRRDEHAAAMFGIGRILRRLEIMLERTGRSGVGVAAGTWGFQSVPAANAVFPPRVKLMPLDWLIELESDDVQTLIRRVSRDRRITPIIWTQHDDHSYVGRPYTPFPKLATRLETSGAHGVGIIHWITRPLDLYFTSTSRQLWDASRDEPLEVTCRRTARRTFGPEAAEAGAQYLIRWIREAPMFGRETTDRFIHRPLQNPGDAVRRARERRLLLESIEERRLTRAGLAWRRFFREYERFIEMFFTVHPHLDRSLEAWKREDRQEAIREIEAAFAGGGPAAVVEQYATAIRQGEITRGEMGLLISLNLRWLPYFHAQRQVLGLEPVLVNFQPTQHDPLAQEPGRNSFFFDEDGKIWAGLGEKETGLPVWTLSPAPPPPEGHDPGLFTSGVQVSKPAELALTALAGVELPAGNYAVKLCFVDEAATPKRVVEVEQPAAASGGKVIVRIRPGRRRTKLCALTIERSPRNGGLAALPGR